MSYLEAGGGDPVVFLHGNPTSSYLWREVIPHVADLGRCLAPDLVGTGESGPSPTGAHRLADRARYLEEWLEAIVPPPPSFDAPRAGVRAPNPTPQSRLPTLVRPREVPMGGQPADVAEVVTGYAHFLAHSEIPKLLVIGDPGMLLHEGGPALEAVRGWPNQREVTVRGRHYLQGDSPHEIGQALRTFVGDAHAGQQHDPPRP